MSNVLNSLPQPPAGKTGWPWTVETDSSHYECFDYFPRISIVTPSFNQDRFLEETIRSVVLQNYPNTELIIIDGGSSDASVEIIKKYSPWIAYWVSEKDQGQSHALNKGFEKATGDWIGWQNSDDIYRQEAFFHFLQACKQKKADVFFGHCDTIDSDSKVIQSHFYPPFSFFELKYGGWNITNQATFFSRAIINDFRINESYRYAMDGDFYFRIAANGSSFALINRVLGAFRLHGDAKTGQHDLTIGVDEWIDIRKRYGIQQSRGPWNSQFRIRKSLCKLRKAFYLAVQGNLAKAIGQNLAKT